MRLITNLNRGVVPLTGSTIFMENLGPSFIERAIERIGGGDVTHVAIVISENVYEANMPCVQKCTWREYLEKIEKWERQKWTIKQGGVNPFYLEPETALTIQQVLTMYNYAESCLGIPYGLLFNYWLGTKLMHCSEFAGGCWNELKLINYREHRESPHSLLTKLLQLEV